MTVKATTENFKDVTAKGTVVVDFWAPWCGPCRMVGPSLEELDEEYGDKLTVAKLNVDENQEIAQEYNVMSIPTLILFQDGKPVEKVVGAYPKAELKKYFDEKIAQAQG